MITFEMYQNATLNALRGQSARFAGEYGLFVVAQLSGLIATAHKAGTDYTDVAQDIVARDDSRMFSKFRELHSFY